MELRRPRREDKETVLDMMAEFEAYQSAHDGSFWNSVDFDYENWIEDNTNFEIGFGLPQGIVPAIQFVLFDDWGRALGFLQLRIRLNDLLLAKGGHIGYSIRPSQRQKGYAKTMLALGLKEAKQKNIQSVLVTCHTENEASRRTILANGGHLEDTRDDVERYWIDL